ncbi:NHL repeat-containing protein [Sphingobacterium paucimobilis]|nr:NHL repeat-containing protein [Sphingobacterium paucimobilis]
MKTNIFIITCFLFLGALIMSSCNKSEERLKGVTKQNVVSSFPQTGFEEDIFTVYGNNLNNSSIRITFNDKDLNIIEKYNDKVLAVIPGKENANEAQVKVYMNSELVLSSVFTYDVKELLYKVITYAGTGERGFLDGPLLSAKLWYCEGVEYDNLGNLYIADRDNNTVRKIAKNSDEITTLLGNNRLSGYINGPANIARLNYPWKIAADNNGNIFVADGGNSAIRKIDNSGNVTTYAGTNSPGLVDGTTTTARFKRPVDVIFDKTGNLYVADDNNHVIRKISTDGTVTTLAGNGTPGYADGSKSVSRLNLPSGLALDDSGNLYIADRMNNRIRKLSPDGTLSTLVGTTAGSIDGPFTTATINQPYGIAYHKAENSLIIAELGGHKIRKIDLTEQVVTTIAGSTQGFADGYGTSAKFNQPTDVTIDPEGNIVVADLTNSRIRKIIKK